MILYDTVGYCMHTHLDLPGTHCLHLMTQSHFLCKWFLYKVISSCLCSVSCSVSSLRFCAPCYSRWSLVTWVWVFRCSVFVAVFLLPDLNWETWIFLHDIPASGILFIRKTYYTCAICNKINLAIQCSVDLTWPYYDLHGPTKSYNLKTICLQNVTLFKHDDHIYLLNHHVIFRSQLSSAGREVYLLVSGSDGHWFPLAHKVVIVVKIVVDICWIRMASLSNSQRFRFPLHLPGALTISSTGTSLLN